MPTSTLVDRVRVLSNTVGTGSLVSLGSAVAGYAGTDALVDGATYSYLIEQGADFEYGRGVYTAAGATFTRNVIKSTLTNARISIGSGTFLSFVLLVEDLNERIGIPANLTIDSVTTGAPGSSALVELSGTTPNFSLAFTIPRGDVGPMGDITPSLTALAAGVQTNANSAATSASAAAESLSEVTAIVARNPSRVSKALDTSVTSSTALIADPDLVVPLNANSLTLLRGNINYSASAAGDFKWRHAGPASPSAFQLKRRAFAPGDTEYSGVAVDTAYSTADIAVLGTSTGSGFVEFEAVVANGANAGNFAFEWAQNASDATPTIVKAASYIEYIPLPTSAVFAFANTAIAKLGAFVGPASAGGHNVINAINPSALAHSYIETMVAGTAADAQLFGAATPFKLQVDGGAETTIPAFVGWAYVNLFTGMADAPHRVRISNGTSYDSDIVLRVSGAAPNVSRPTDIPNFYPFGQTPYDGYIAADGVTALDGSTGAVPQRIWTAGSGFGIRFGATTTSVRIWLYNPASNGPIVLLQDGAAIATVTPASGLSRYEVITLATGLSGTHEYEIKFISMSIATFAYAVLVDTLTAAAHPARACDAYYGDSIVQGTSSGSTDARVTDAYILATATSRAAIRVGVGGTGVSVDNGNLAVKYGRDHTADITGLTATPTRVFVCYGVNDLFYSVPLATFQADYQTMLSNLRTGLPFAKIYARGILPQYRNLDSDRVLYNARISAAVAALADANIVYINTDGWVSTSPGVDLADSVHPKASGYAKVAAAQQLVL